MSSKRRRRPAPAPKAGGGAGAPVSGQAGKPPSAPQARRPGHARRLRLEALRAAEVERERSAAARRRAHIGFRIAILALLGMFVFAITFPTMRLYLADQQELRALRADAATARAATDDINAELARWSDPAFVEAQARDRLSYVQPGDVAYRVVDPEKAPQLEATPAAEPEPEVKRPVGDGGDTTGQTPWYTALWQSVQVAGAAPAAPEPAETAEAEPGTEAEDPGR